MRIKRILTLVFFFIALASLFPIYGQTSRCYRFEDVNGDGQFPYNFRVIDDVFLAGGYLFNPVGKENSTEKVLELLSNLKLFGTKSIILLHVPQTGDYHTSQLEKLCKIANLELIKMRMNAEQVPDKQQTEFVLEKIKAGAYVHCMWGCDRTGAIIAKYLVEEKGYSPQQAFEAIIAEGSHSGKKGGFKKIPGNQKLLLYFWPKVASEAPEIYQHYQ